MWDTVQTNQQHLSHDRPCSETCSCEVGRASATRAAAPLALV